MVFDPVDGYVLLFGGVTGDPGTNLGETWAFLGGNWTQLHPLHSPPPTNSADLAFDGADGYVLLHGSDPDALGQNSYGQTWSFAHGDWTNLTETAGPEPPANGPADSMDYDPADGYVVLAGISVADIALNETWTFAAGRWTNRTTSSGPEAAGLMQWDADLNSLVFAGSGRQLFANRSGSFCNDTWLYHAGIWNRTGWPSRCDMTGASMAYDGFDHEMVLYNGGGGNCDIVACNATWILQGTRWFPRALSPTPDVYGFAAMAYDSADSEVVLFGGGVMPAGRSDATWVYASGSWNKIAPAQAAPGTGIDLVVAAGAVIIAAAAGPIVLVLRRRGHSR